VRSIGTVEMLGQSTRTSPHRVAELARTIAARHDEAGPRGAGDRDRRRRRDGVHARHHRGAFDRCGGVGERKGVCQDITHITLGALREVGIPALCVGVPASAAGCRGRRARDR
jgi:transglutaminase-like putative cysteine protease